ncbi:hypothetical protein STEG23_013643, partial [Scotinomys teguina]
MSSLLPTTEILVHNTSSIVKASQWAGSFQNFRLLFAGIRSKNKPKNEEPFIVVNVLIDRVPWGYKAPKVHLGKKVKG